MGLLVFILIGALAGWLAGKISKGSGFGVLGNIAIGCGGALLGGLLGNLVGLHAYGLLGQILLATAGAVLLLFIIGKLKR